MTWAWVLIGVSVGMALLAWVWVGWTIYQHRSPRTPDEAAITDVEWAELMAAAREADDAAQPPADGRVH